MKGNCAPTSDAPNLQRLVYDVDVAVGATECNPTQAAAREAAVKCHGMEAWGAYKFSDRWAPSCQGNSQLSLLLYKDGTSIRIMKSTDMTCKVC